MQVRSVLVLMMLFICTLLIAGCGKDEPGEWVNQQEPEEWVNQLDNYLNKLEQDDMFMGSVAISRDGKIIYSKANGYRDVKNQVQADTNSLYRIGSVTKTFTSVLVLQLIEEGKLTFETKLSKFYPEVPNAEKITICHLLKHQSGLFSLTADPWHQTVYTDFRTKEENIAVIAQYDPVFEPGEGVQYCNSGYILLSYIIEDVTGKDYNANLQERICDRLDLDLTRIGGKINPDKNESLSYVFTLHTGWELADEPDTSISYGAGAIVSTAEELTIFMHALFNNQLIEKSSLAEMLKIEDGEGMGIKPLPYTKIGYGHPGAMPGFYSIAGHILDDNITFAITTNGFRHDLFTPLDLWTGVLQTYYRFN
jgi:D-alanyl-D-alanine carboxypeptidase